MIPIDDRLDGDSDVPDFERIIEELEAERAGAQFLTRDSLDADPEIPDFEKFERDLGAERAASNANLS